jgi:adiponectin receptor
MRENVHITDGYRVNFTTTRKILRSLFMVHNQSVNIWSHCLPAIFIIVFTVTFYFTVDGQAISRSF